MNGKEGEEVFFLSLFRFSLSFFKKPDYSIISCFFFSRFFRETYLLARRLRCVAPFFLFCVVCLKKRNVERGNRERERKTGRGFSFFSFRFSHICSTCFFGKTKASLSPHAFSFLLFSLSSELRSALKPRRH